MGSLRHKEGKEKMIRTECNCVIRKGCIVHDNNLIVTSYGTYTPSMDSGQSHGMDFESEVKHLDEDKAWGEFKQWVKDRHSGYGNYEDMSEYNKISWIIAYLKINGYEKKQIIFANLNVEFLESVVKSLKPVKPVDEDTQLRAWILKAIYDADIPPTDKIPLLAEKLLKIIKDKE